jgi:tetraacyldisaccharide 4'-kinase
MQIFMTNSLFCRKITTFATFLPLNCSDLQKFLSYILGLPFTTLYAMTLAVRHFLYNVGILRSCSFDFPVICVGNLAVGGTGKTPHTLLIANILREKNIRFAILSRGYKRTSKGFLYIKSDDTAATAGDEPLLMKRRLPDDIVAVCKNRISAIRRIKTDFPDVQAIILDDAFQYRKLNAGLNLLLTPYNRLMTQDLLLPLGRLRDLRSRRCHADIVITTQYPSAMQPIDHKVLLKNLKLFPYQRNYCTQYRYLPVVSLLVNNEFVMHEHSEVIAVAGIANPQGFLTYVKNRYKVIETIIFGDHHRFGKRSVRKIRQALQKCPDAVIITTEKDAMRLLSCGLQATELARIAYQPIEIEFLMDEYVNFSQNILNYVKTNKRINDIYCQQ